VATDHATAALVAPEPVEEGADPGWELMREDRRVDEKLRVIDPTVPSADRVNDPVSVVQFCAV
jgi:hypothetical protein